MREKDLGWSPPPTLELPHDLVMKKAREKERMKDSETKKQKAKEQDKRGGEREGPRMESAPDSRSPS